MKCSFYIIQEKIANYTYVDVIEETDKEYILDMLSALQNKYPFKKYRLVIFNLANYKGVE